MDTYPRQSARTRRFTLGRPRSFTVSEDGRRIVFLRSPAGDDPVTGLWTWDADAGERLLADPRNLGGHEGDLPAAERARRERARETAGGVVAYSTDPACRVAAFALAGRLFVADLDAGTVRALPAQEPVFDPRPDPTCAAVAYCSGRQLRVVTLDGSDRVLAAEDDADVTWGQAEFIAAEEMGRGRGFWWSPDGRRIAATRVDTTPVTRWYIANPAEPSSPATEVAYPAAGTDNAVVSLFVLDLDGTNTPVDWDADAFPYLARVLWNEGAPLTVLVQARDQRTMQVRTADPDTGLTTMVREDRDPTWLEIVPGVPDWTDDGKLVWTVDDGDTRRLLVGDDVMTPEGLQVEHVLATDPITFVASDDATESHVFRLGSGGTLERLTTLAGLHGAVVAGSTAVITSSTLADTGSRAEVHPGGHVFASLAERPVIQPSVSLLRGGSRDLNIAVLLPREYDERRPLPVLLDPYGGPHAARVVKAADAFLSSQWFADQGFAVVVADGRGTPGRGPRWEKEVAGDLAAPVLDDQVDALYAAAEAHPDLDLARVAIRGWSFGGYLAALAVLRRPDVFHAAVAGAPVTDWRLYDTHYTERYLGLPQAQPEHYRRTSLLEDAHRLERPLLLIHGMADDNVVVAHTLQLSRALLEAGRPHSVLPLSGVTHMTPQEVVAENLLLVQVAFLESALGLDQG